MEPLQTPCKQGKGCSWVPLERFALAFLLLHGARELRVFATDATPVLPGPCLCCVLRLASSFQIRADPFSSAECRLPPSRTSWLLLSCGTYMTDYLIDKSMQVRQQKPKLGLSQYQSPLPSASNSPPPRDHEVFRLVYDYSSPLRRTRPCRLHHSHPSSTTTPARVNQTDHPEEAGQPHPQPPFYFKRHQNLEPVGHPGQYCRYHDLQRIPIPRLRDARVSSPICRRLVVRLHVRSWFPRVFILCCWLCVPSQSLTTLDEF